MSSDKNLKTVSSVILPIYVVGVFAPYLCGGHEKCENFWASVNEGVETHVEYNDIRNALGTQTVSGVSSASVYPGNIY